MLSKIFSKKEVSFPWTRLTNLNQLDQLDELSKEKPVLIFKHSTRCSISTMALNRFERSYTPAFMAEPFYLDLIAYRNISNSIAERYNVRHESPQVILVKNGIAQFDASHMDINYDKLNEEAGAL